MWHRRNQTCPMCRTPTQGTLGAKTVDSFLKAMLEDVLERDDWLAYERRCEEADARAQQAKAAREQSGRKRTRDGAPHQANGLTRVGGAARTASALYAFGTCSFCQVFFLAAFRIELS